MAYSAEVVKRARARLAQAKEDRESENRQHLAEAYNKVPRIREIDIQLRRTMASAAQAAFLQGSDGRDLMDQVRQQNLELQRERQQLAQRYFEEGYLDDSPVCDQCGGSGYVGTNMCECLRELCRQEQKKEVSILSGSKDTFSQFRLDYYPDKFDGSIGASPRAIMEKNFQNCRRYALMFTPNAGNLLFVGGTGLGKTFLSACVARAVADRGYSVVYETSAHLFGKLEAAKFSPNEENRREAAKFTDCDLLIIDDLGTEMPGQFVTAAFYSLLNDRILAGKPMVISTNLNVDEMSRRYSPQIASRLHGSFQRLTFVGEDIRVMKNRGTDMTGILFDLDGTLMDTLEDLLDATNYALNLHGFPPRTLPELRRFVGNGALNQIRLSCPENTPPETVEAVLADYKPYYTAHCQIKTKPYQGIPEALAELAEKYPVAIVSNKPDAAVKALCTDFFPGVYAMGETPDCPRKPKPDMVWRAMAALGADHCIYVGDSEVDVVTAQNAGVPCVSVLWGFRDRADMEAVGTPVFCERTRDLVQILEELIHG